MMNYHGKILAKVLYIITLITQTYHHEGIFLLNDFQETFNNSFMKKIILIFILIFTAKFSFFYCEKKT